MIDSPNSIQASTVNIQTKKQKISLLPPKGSIGENIKVRAYVKHLIDRYNKYASSDPTRKRKFSFGGIYKNIIDNFGTKWDMLPVEKATEIIEYLQSRINKTRQAKINKGKGYKRYSSFDEYIAKYFSKTKNK